MGPEQEEQQDQEASIEAHTETLPAMDDIISEKVLERIKAKKRGEERLAELDRLLTEEGLRARVSARTKFMLEYMAKHFNKGNHCRFERLLAAEEGQLEPMSSETLWKTLDSKKHPQRRRIMLDQIGQAVRLELNGTSARMEARVAEGNTGERMTLPTKDPMFTVVIEHQPNDDTDSHQLIYQFVKMTD